MGFSEPLTAGETILQNVQSEGFQSGVTGWRIERSGNAEFNQVQITGGSLEVNGSDPDAEVRIATISGTPMILITDTNGNVFEIVAPVAGVIRMGWQLSSPQLFFNRGGTLELEQGSGDTGFMVIDGESWSVASLQNSWNVTGVGVFDPPGYRKMPDGTVMLRGVTVAGTKTDGTTIFTLPSGYRPARRKHIAVSGDVIGQTPVIQINGISDVGTEGQVKIFRMNTANAIGLDGVSFELV